MDTENFSKKTVRRLAYISLLVATSLASLYVYGIFVRFSPFFTTSSPQETYTVKLLGQKQRLFFFTVEVHYSVLKNERAFISDQYLHSGDAMDISFESGFPDHEWVNENALRFFQRDCTEKTNSDSVVLENRSSQIVKSARVFSVDKYLLFDIQTGMPKILNVCPSKGDLSSIYIEAERYDGKIYKKGATFPKHNGVSKSITYLVNIDDDFVTIEGTYKE
jgi:hypothetical protein